MRGRARTAGRAARSPRPSPSTWNSFALVQHRDQCLADVVLLVITERRIQRQREDLPCRCFGMREIPFLATEVRIALHGVDWPRIADVYQDVALCQGLH